MHTYIYNIYKDNGPPLVSFVHSQRKLRKNHWLPLKGEGPGKKIHLKIVLNYNGKINL